MFPLRSVCFLLFLAMLIGCYGNLFISFFWQTGTGEVTLEFGEKIRLTPNKEFENKCNKNILYVDYEHIVHVLHVGSKVFIDDGLISLAVQEKGIYSPNHSIHN